MIGAVVGVAVVIFIFVVHVAAITSYSEGLFFIVTLITFDVFAVFPSTVIVLAVDIAFCIISVTVSEEVVVFCCQCRYFLRYRHSALLRRGSL